MNFLVIPVTTCAFVQWITGGNRWIPVSPTLARGSDKKGDKPVAGLVVALHEAAGI